jgi:hypothetical protein
MRYRRESGQLKIFKPLAIFGIFVAIFLFVLVISKFNYRLLFNFFPEEERANLYDLWQRWVRKGGRTKATRQMSCYLLQRINILPS